MTLGLFVTGRGLTKLPDICDVFYEFALGVKFQEVTIVHDSALNESGTKSAPKFTHTSDSCFTGCVLFGCMQLVRCR